MSTSIPRPKNLCLLLFSQREKYIQANAPYIAHSERGFNASMKALNYEFIDPLSESQRRDLFNLKFIGIFRQKTYHTHTWSSALHLRDNEFHHPCARCELLHTGMDHYQVYGERCVIWRKVYAPMNCAEPLCLSMAIEADKFGKLYHTTSSEQNRGRRII